MTTIAWLLEADGSVLPVVKKEASFWPGAVRVTLEDGTTRTAHRDDLLAADDLDRRAKI